MQRGLQSARASGQFGGGHDQVEVGGGGSRGTGYAMRPLATDAQRLRTAPGTDQQAIAVVQQSVS